MVPRMDELLWVTIESATFERLFVAVKRFWKSWFSEASTATAGPMVSMPFAMAASPLASCALSAASEARALSTELLLALSAVTVKDTIVDDLADLLLVPAQRLVQVGDDRLELVEATAVEQRARARRGCRRWTVRSRCRARGPPTRW